MSNGRVCLSNDKSELCAVHGRHATNWCETVHPDASIVIWSACASIPDREMGATREPIFHSLSITDLSRGNSHGPSPSARQGRRNLRGPVPTRHPWAIPQLLRQVPHRVPGFIHVGQFPVSSPYPTTRTGNLRPSVLPKNRHIQSPRERIDISLPLARLLSQVGLNPKKQFPL
jgi:hypothetical protein